MRMKLCGKGDILEPATLGERQRQCLQIVVAQHQRRHLVGHQRQERVALLLGEAAVEDGASQRDLEVHLDVGGVDAGRIVDRVGVEAHPGARRFDAAALRHAEIGALADHLGPHLSAGDAHRVVGAVADLGVALDAART